MNLLMRLLYKWQKRKMCKCTSPTYLAKGGILQCKDCGKPLHKLDVKLDLDA